MGMPGLIIIAAVGAVTGIVIGALWARALAGARRSALERAAASEEARNQELRRQLEEADRDFSELRAGLSESEKARSAAEARLAETVRNLQEQRDLLEEARARLTDTFKSLAAEALTTNREGFLALAEQKFKALSDSARTDLDHRKLAIEGLIRPLQDTLAQYRDEAQVLEARRLREISAVSEQLRSVAAAQTALQVETGRLVNALKSPQVRGRWGEIALRKTAELAGMSRHCDFALQESVAGEDGRLRPDMIVRLPAGREVVVDSKVPLGGFMEALEAATEDGRQQAMSRHALQMRQHIAKLSSKEYWNQFPTAPEFVVMFIPNDSFLAAAAERDPGLVESALTQNVVIATPTTFIALLRAIAFGWRQEVIAASARRISELGQELSDRLATVSGYLADLGRSLSRSVESYNAAVGSFEARLFATARKFRELGAEGKKEIPELSPVDQSPRNVSVETLGMPEEQTLGT